MRFNASNKTIARRDFCRHITFGLVASVVGGFSSVNWFVAEVRADESPPGQFLLPLADYPELANANSSVVITIPGTPNGFANIVVTRATGNQFFAVDSTCAHNQCQVPPAIYNASSAQNEITCSCHGSRYKANGELLGGPAQRNLRAFTATLVSTQLVLNIPEFRFTLGATRSQPVSGGNRLKITFAALSFLTYNVRYRSSVQAPWTTVPFSKFATGSLIQTDYLGIGADAEIFVAAPHPAGFFSVVAI
jgi:nitrite reductase/ring-hydroxylating ferredoxin subunit